MSRLASKVRALFIKVRDILLEPVYRVIINILTVDFFTKEVIRLGRDNDGGYVVLKREKPYKYLLSFGIANDISFEQDFARNNPSCKIYCFDPSITGLPEPLDDAVFYKKGITGKAYDDYLDIFQIVDLIGEPGLKNFKNNFKDIFVKIDIEGNEWAVLSSRSYEFLKNIDQLVMEIHFNSVVRGNKFLLPFYMIRRCCLLKKLRKDFVIFNIHVNNTGGFTSYKKFVFPLCVELSLLNKKSISNYLYDINQVSNPAFTEIKQYPFIE